MRLILAGLALIAGLAIASVVYAAAGTNASCGDAERDAHSIVGPDGGTYQTFAPQRDDIRPNGTTGTFCFFGVEHGTSPRTVMMPVAGWPLYNYATGKAGVAVENQEGFKSIGFYLDGYRVLYTLHRESGKGIGHTCESFHEIHLAVADNDTGELLYRRSQLADFGPATYNRDETLIFKPLACPNQHAIAHARSTQHVGRRLEPLKNAPDGQPILAYNPWQFDPIYGVTGLDGYISHNRIATTYACKYAGPENWCEAATVVPTGTKGISSRLVVWLARLYATGQASGDFCTDPYGTVVQDCGLSNSVRQYAKPGFDWDRRASQVECGDIYSENGRLYFCSDEARNTFQDFQDVSGKLKADRN